MGFYVGFGRLNAVTAQSWRSPWTVRQDRLTPTGAYYEMIFVKSIMWRTEKKSPMKEDTHRG
ncbi:MAG: hypothetical protein Kow0070_01210 [Anaerolineales bacterium]